MPASSGDCSWNARNAASAASCSACHCASASTYAPCRVSSMRASAGKSQRTRWRRADALEVGDRKSDTARFAAARRVHRRREPFRRRRDGRRVPRCVASAPARWRRARGRRRRSACACASRTMKRSPAAAHTGASNTSCTACRSCRARSSPHRAARHARGDRSCRGARARATTCAASRRRGSDAQAHVDARARRRARADRRSSRRASSCVRSMPARLIAQRWPARPASLSRWSARGCRARARECPQASASDRVADMDHARVHGAGHDRAVPRQREHAIDREAEQAVVRGVRQLQRRGVQMVAQAARPPSSSSQLASTAKTARPAGRSWRAACRPRRVPHRVARIDAIDLGQRDRAARDAEQIEDREMFARLRHDAVVGGDRRAARSRCRWRPRPSCGRGARAPARRRSRASRRSRAARRRSRVRSRCRAPSLP